MGTGDILLGVTPQSSSFPSRGGGGGSNTPNCFMLQKPVRSGSVHWPLRLLVWLEQLSEFAEFQDTEELSNDASFSTVYFLFIFRQNTIFQKFSASRCYFVHRWFVSST